MDQKLEHVGSVKGIRSVCDGSESCLRKEGNDGDGSVSGAVLTDSASFFLSVVRTVSETATQTPSHRVE